MSPLKYRPDIDGLRAIAVIMVVLFHAQLDLFKGGFVGVDVFFVISGYLITSQIMIALQEGRFSFKEFWIRRARRILPVQLVVLAATLIICHFLYFPKDFTFVASQTLSQLVFISNIFFFKSSGYFSANDMLMPLKHMWSLAVEQQFYLFMPVLVWLIWIYCRRHLVLLLVTVASISFLACIWMTSVNSNAAFYLLPFRFWELMMGGLIVFVPQRIFSRPVERDILSLIGVFLIAMSAFTYSPDTLFPGFAALFPCLGAALIIFAGMNTIGKGGRFLSLAPLPFIGKVSYSIYLWHWPVLMIVFYMQPQVLSWYQTTIILVIIFCLSIASWLFVERPFRQKFSSSHFIYMMLACVTLTAMAGFLQIYLYKKSMSLVSLSMEVKNQTKQKDTQHLCKAARKDFNFDRVCQTNPDSGFLPEFVVWGDSHALASLPIFFEISKKYGRNGYILAYGGCAPILGVLIKGDKKSETCRDYNEQVVNFIRSKKIKHVFFISHWAGWYNNEALYLDDESRMGGARKAYNNQIIAASRYTIDLLLAMNVRPYYVIGVPMMPFDVSHLLAMENRLGVKNTKAWMPLSKYMDQRLKGVDPFVASLKDKDVVVIDPLNRFCPEKECIAVINGKSLYADDDHLSLEGAQYEMPLFERYFHQGFSNP